MSVKTKAGRPSKYSLDIAEQILGRIENGESVRRICQEDGMPSVSTVMLWLADHEDFRSRYTRAKQIQVEAMEEELLEFADERAEDPQRSRLQVETRKWLLAKLIPKKYGDKIDVAHGGEVSVRVVIGGEGA
jgi:hypothetical protein